MARAEVKRLYGAKSRMDSLAQAVADYNRLERHCERIYAMPDDNLDILQLFNEGSVVINKDDRSSKSIDVSRFAILMGGAFVGLEDIIKELVCPKVKIGFSMNEQENIGNQNWLSMTTAKDLCRYGLMMELLGRVGTILTISPLGMDDYRQLLNAESGSLKNKYDNYLHGLYGVRLQIAEGGVDAMARACMKASDAGARAAEPLLGGFMREPIERVERDDNISGVRLWMRRTIGPVCAMSAVRKGRTKRRTVEEKAHCLM